MIQVKDYEDGISLSIKGKVDNLMNELLTINLSCLKQMSETKSQYDNLKDSLVMLLTNDEVTNNFYENIETYNMEVYE